MGEWTSGRFEPNLAHCCVRATGYRTGSWAACGLRWPVEAAEDRAGVVQAAIHLCARLRLTRWPGHFPAGWGEPALQVHVRCWWWCLKPG